MKFYSVGGFNEVGKNMSAVEVGNEVVIMDMGYLMDKIVTLDEEDRNITTKELMEIGAIPDDRHLVGKNVQAIVISHGHLDHAGAVTKMALKYKCPVIGSPYTIELIRRMAKDEGVTELNKHLYALDIGKKIPVSANFEVEFVRMTHSIPQTALIALHTREGLVTYLNDYKLDNKPTLGEIPDYKRMKQLAKEGIRLHVNETVRIFDSARTPPEYVAKVLVQDAIDRAYEEDDKGAVAITTFASHIARINNIIQANADRRKVLLLGRSMQNYVGAATELKIIDIGNSKIFGRRKTVAKALKDVAKKPSDYLLICTGNQGEPNSVLSRVARGEFAFKFQKEDQVIFSSEVIPVPINQANMANLSGMLRGKGVRMMQNVHVSGHGRREDQRDILRLLQPQIVVPSHGATDRLASYAQLAMEEGYRLGDTVKILHNGAEEEIK